MGTPKNEEHDRQQQISDLAFQYCEASQLVDWELSMEPYLVQLPDDEAREEFAELVNADMILRAIQAGKKEKGRR